MGQQVALADVPPGRGIASPPSRKSFVAIDLFFQIGLLFLFGSSIWLLIGPEGNTPWHHRVAYAALIGGYATVITVGTLAQDWRPRTKWIVGSIMLLSPLPILASSLIEREMSFRLLESARIENRRVVHDWLGLSYSALPNWRFRLQPVLSRERSQEVKSVPLPSHLRYGDVVMLSQFMDLSSVDAPGRVPTSISVFVQHHWGAGSSAFVNAVRQFESRVEKSGNGRIRQRTHRVHVAGADGLQFEYIQMAPKQISRQLFIPIGGYVVFFVMSTGDEKDDQLFDEFTNSIHLQSIFSTTSK